MTDQEKADLELSISLLDQAASSDKVTVANKDLRDATEIEVDASLKLTDSKERVTDQMNDLEYTISEQNRAEKQYLNTLDRRIEIERKIGLVDYSQIDKRLHDKIVDELQKRLKAEEEKNKKNEENNEEEDETDEKQRKSDSEYLREAEKYHKKRIGMFKKVSEMHKNYMQTSNSFMGRMAMGALGKGTSELMSAIDGATDMIPGAKTAKRVGGFVRDQWRDTREGKRQKKIENTAKILRARDETPISDKADDNQKKTDSRKSTEGIVGMGLTLERILGFLKKLGEAMMIMGILKSVVGLMGSAISGLAGLISSGVMSALSALGIVGLLKGISTAITSGIAKLASALGMKLPGMKDSPNMDGPDADKDKKTKNKPEGKNSKRTPKKPPTPSKTPGKMSRLWNWGKGLVGATGEAAASRGALATIGRTATTINPLTVGATAALYSPAAGEGSDDTTKYQDIEHRADVAERNRKSILKGYSDEYKDSYGKKPLLNDNGEIQLYPNPNNDSDIQVENERRFKIAVDTGSNTNSEKEFRELSTAATELERVKLEKEAAGRQQLITSMGQQNNMTNINNTVNNTKQFGFSPYEYSSNNYSRGEIK